MESSTADSKTFDEEKDGQLLAGWMLYEELINRSYAVAHLQLN